VAKRRKIIHKIKESVS